MKIKACMTEVLQMKKLLTQQRKVPKERRKKQLLPHKFVFFFLWKCSLILAFYMT